MPRFKFSTDVGLNDTLSALGMPEAFTDGADFSGINGARDLRVQAVIHKAIIAVDEKGTTASAATGVSVGVDLGAAARWSSTARSCSSSATTRPARSCSRAGSSTRRSSCGLSKILHPIRLPFEHPFKGVAA